MKPSADFRVAVFPGDGIGHEVMTPCLELLQAAARAVGGFALSFETLPAGAGCYRDTGKALPAASMAAARRADAILLAAMGLPDVRYPDGASVPDGEYGEVHVRSAYTMLRYFNDDGATRAALKPGRWLAMGDVGKFEEGRLYIDSRARDMILRAAENVYPIEIEHRLEAHPAVAEAAVVGVDHPELGQEVKAVVVLRDGAEVTPGELAEFAGVALAPYKVPSKWELRREPLPRNAAGKLVKREL